MNSQGADCLIRRMMTLGGPLPDGHGSVSIRSTWAFIRSLMLAVSVLEFGAFTGCAALFHLKSQHRVAHVDFVS